MIDASSRKPLLQYKRRPLCRIDAADRPFALSRHDFKHCSSAVHIAPTASLRTSASTPPLFLHNFGDGKVIGLGARQWLRNSGWLRRTLATPPSNSGSVVLIGGQLLAEGEDCHLLRQRGGAAITAHTNVRRHMLIHNVEKCQQWRVLVKCPSSSATPNYLHNHQPIIEKKPRALV